MNTTLKRGNIVKRYNDDKGIYQYGVVADTLIFLGNRCVISFMYRKEAMNFYTWTDDEPSFIRVEQESLPSELCFLSDISKIFAHVRVDYVISGEIWGTTIGYRKLLTQFLDSDNLSMVIERCVDVNKGVFAGDKIFFNELEYWFRRCWVKYDNVEIRFYRV